MKAAPAACATKSGTRTARCCSNIRACGRKTPLLSAPWGLGGRTVIGSLLAFPGSRFLLESLRTLQSAGENALVSATLLDGLLVCRYLGHHIQQAKELFHSAWERLRPQVIGLMPERPRAWDC